MPYNRRCFFRTISASVVSTIPAVASRFREPLGVELSTVRELLPGNPDITLKRIADIGYTEVELTRADLSSLGPICRNCGLAIPSVHLETSLLVGGREQASSPPAITWVAAVHEARSFGAGYVVIPNVSPEERRTPDDWRAFCEKLNRAGEAAHKAGARLCYHNHAFEFEGKPGQRLMDVLLERTDSKLVGLEVDVFWLSAAGQEPIEFIRRNASRVHLVHLEDKPRRMPVLTDEAKAQPSDFKEAGKGSLDFPAILRASEKAGVAHYFVEQDHTPGDPVESLRASYEYLRALTM